MLLMHCILSARQYDFSLILEHLIKRWLMHFVVSMMVSKVQFAYHEWGLINYIKVQNICVLETALVASPTHSFSDLRAEVCPALGGFRL